MSQQDFTLDGLVGSLAGTGHYLNNLGNAVLYADRVEMTYSLGLILTNPSATTLDVIWQSGIEPTFSSDKSAVYLHVSASTPEEAKEAAMRLACFASNASHENATRSNGAGSKKTELMNVEQSGVKDTWTLAVMYHLTPNDLKDAFSRNPQMVNLKGLYNEYMQAVSNVVYLRWKHNHAVDMDKLLHSYGASPMRQRSDFI